MHLLISCLWVKKVKQQTTDKEFMCWRIRKESWVPKNWCFWTAVWQKTLENCLDCNELKPVNFKGNQSWILFGRTDAEVEATILWPPDVKNWPFKKDPDAGTDWKQEKGTEEDETVGWHHWLDGQEFEQALGVGDGQGSLVCCSLWGWKESDMTEWLNWMNWDESSSYCYMTVIYTQHPQTE